MSSNYSPGVTGCELDDIDEMDIAEQRALIEAMNEEDHEVLFGYLEARDDLTLYIEWAEDWQADWGDRLEALSGHTVEVARLGHCKEVAAQARIEASLEHARMVRQLAEVIYSYSNQAIAEEMERLAQVIEKGGH